MRNKFSRQDDYEVFFLNIGGNKIELISNLLDNSYLDFGLKIKEYPVISYKINLYLSLFAVHHLRYFISSTNLATTLHTHIQRSYDTYLDFVMKLA